MAEIWILRGKHEIFFLRFFLPDELQELQWGHVGRRVARNSQWGAVRGFGGGAPSARKFSFFLQK